MADRTEDVYGACDRAIKAMNRENVRDFGRLKTADWEQLNVIREVTAVYRTSARRARKRYKRVAEDVYELMMLWLDYPGEKARQMAEKAITDEWVDAILTETDFVTLYRFDTETERKAQRLIEALAASGNRDAEIDKALRYWSRQLGQYAINFTDYAMIQAFEDAGIEEVVWVTQRDERVCEECRPRDGMVYRLDEVPVKHWGCRCSVIPARWRT